MTLMTKKKPRIRRVSALWGQLGSCKNFGQLFRAQVLLSKHIVGLDWAKLDTRKVGLPNKNKPTTFPLHGKPDHMTSIHGKRDFLPKDVSKKEIVGNLSI